MEVSVTEDKWYLKEENPWRHRQHTEVIDGRQIYFISFSQRLQSLGTNKVQRYAVNILKEEKQ